MKTKTIFVKTAPAVGLGLLLATGLWTVTFLYPLTALAAAPVSLTLKGQWPGYARGPAQHVAVQGHCAYAAAHEGGLHVIDISDPANPVRVGGYHTSGYAYAYGVAVAGDYACVAAYHAGLQVIDVSNPANPVRMGGVDTVGSWAEGVTVAGNHAYVAESRWEGDQRISGLQVIDVSDPANPVRVGGYDTSGRAWDVAMAGNHAYVADGGRWTGSNYVGSLQVIDVNNPANPVRVGGVDTGGYADGVAVAGNRAYVADFDGRLEVIDVSDPANPVRVGGVDTGGQALEVVLEGNYAYVVADTSGLISAPVLRVIDVSNPVNPVGVSGFIANWSASGVAVIGDLIYVADGQSGLLILEQSTAAPPSRQWFQVATPPAIRPAARAFPSMVYDSARGIVFLHGGVPQDVAFADTWAWDGENWVRLAQQGPAAFAFGFAFDTDRGVAILHGGLGNGSPQPTLGATWEWDGQSWRQVSNGDGPGLRAGSAMAYDPQRKRVLLHGGVLDLDANTILSDTWAWDGTSWQEIPNANGLARAQHSMAYDERRQVMVLFGGFGPRGSGPVDTWEFDGTQWRQATTDGPPGARQFPILAYDPLRQAILLFGGGEYPPIGGPDYKYFNDVWEWNGNAWAEISVKGARPTPVIAGAGAYDPQRGRFVRFGGTTDFPNRVGTNETWEYGLLDLRVTGVEPLDPDSIEIRWTGGAPPYQLQSRSDLNAGDWQDEGEPTDALIATVPADGAAKFFRVLSLFGHAP